MFEDSDRTHARRYAALYAHKIREHDICRFERNVRVTFASLLFLVLRVNFQRRVEVRNNDIRLLASYSADFKRFRA